MTEELEHVQCLIIGSGPAGYTAAIYAARADLKPVMITGMQMGGQLTQTTDVENFPGYPDGIMGPEMMEDFRKQAERFGTDIRFGYVSSVDFSGNVHKVVVDESKTILADTVIVSTGAAAKWLGLPSEEKYNGFGVSACAVCDGFFFKNQDVVIVGAGDTAAEEATYLAKLCNKVTMLVRKDEFRASKAMVNRVLNTKNIEILYNTETKEILGDGKSVTAIRAFNNITQEEFEIPATGFFVAIGHKPNTEIFNGQLNMDDLGYLQVKLGTSKTNIDGVFVAGDCGRGQSLIVWAIAEGRSAASAVDTYLTGDTQLPYPIAPTARPMMV